MENKIIEKELSYQLVGIFFKIQKELGRFCREKQYADLLEKELKLNKINFKREYCIEIGDKKTNFVDFIIESRVLIELKAKPFLEKDDFYQIKRYLEISELKLGLLINFRDKYLKPKRVLNSKKQFVDSHKFVVSQRSGFTIIELIIYVLIFAVIGTLASAVFGLAVKSKTTIGRSGEIQISVQKAVEQIIDRVHSSLTINGASSTLSLKMSDVNKDPTIFSLSAGAVNIKEGTGAAAPVTPTTVFITSLSFTKIDNPAPATSSVQIQITGGYNNAGVADSSTLYSIQTTALPL